MPTYKNPLISRIASDGVFGGGVQDNIRSSMNSTFANLRGSPSGVPVAEEQPNMAPQAGQAGGVSSPINIAAGNIFGGGIPSGERNAIASLPPAVQAAGLLSGMGDMGQLNAFQVGLRDAGINLNPEGQSPGDYQNAVRGAQGIYNNVFGGGMPQPSGVQAFAPTGLRNRAIGAGGAPVAGIGDVSVSARPNAQGGTAFSLSQNPRIAASVPANPFQSALPANGPSQAAMDFLQTGVAPQVSEPAAPQFAPANQTIQPTQASPAIQTPFQKNADIFRNHLVTQQMQAGIMKGIPPGYMLDPNKPNAILPIPGGPAELQAKQAALEYSASQQKVKEAESASQEKVRQQISSAESMLGTIDRVLPKISSKTVGWGSLASFVPESEAKDVAADIEKINSALGVDSLQQMRAAAQNGASGFGQFTDKEFTRLVASKANLDTAQSPQQIRKNIVQIKTSYDNLLKLAKGINPQTGNPIKEGDKDPSVTAPTVKQVGRFKVTESP